MVLSNDDSFNHDNKLTNKEEFKLKGKRDAFEFIARSAGMRKHFTNTGKTRSKAKQVFCYRWNEITKPIEVHEGIISPGDVQPSKFRSPRRSALFLSEFQSDDVNAGRWKTKESSSGALDFPDCRRTSLVLAGKPRKRVITLSRRIKYFRL